RFQALPPRPLRLCAIGQCAEAVVRDTAGTVRDASQLLRAGLPRVSAGLRDQRSRRSCRRRRAPSHRRVSEPRHGPRLRCPRDRTALGANPNMSTSGSPHKAPRHDVIVLADSDVQVGPDYLRTVVAPLADSGTGLVTCLYGAVPMPGLPSALGAMYVNDWFFP